MGPVTGPAADREHQPAQRRPLSAPRAANGNYRAAKDYGTGDRTNLVLRPHEAAANQRP